MKNAPTPHLTAMRKNAAKAEALLKQLSNRNRLVLLCQLVEGERTVGDLAKTIGISQSAISQHLSKLREAQLVEADKRGQEVYYRLCSAEAQTLLSVLYFMFCKP
jgi:DNA-binding transcriptional ArsR family regulator